MQCGWLGTEPLGTGQGWLGCRCPVPATWLDALWLAGHWCDSRGRGPTARRHWGQPQGRVHRGSHCHDAVGTLCPSSSGHLPTWGSRLGWRGDKRRLVTMVSAALPPPPSSCAASQGAGCLPACSHCCSPSRSPWPPRDPSVRAGGRLRRAGGAGSAIWSRGPWGLWEPVQGLGLGPMSRDRWGSPWHRPHQALVWQRGRKPPAGLVSRMHQTRSSWEPAGPPSLAPRPRSPCALRSLISK